MPGFLLSILTDKGDYLDAKRLPEVKEAYGKLLEENAEYHCLKGSTLKIDTFRDDLAVLSFRIRYKEKQREENLKFAKGAVYEALRSIYEDGKTKLNIDVLTEAED